MSHVILENISLSYPIYDSDRRLLKRTLIKTSVERNIDFNRNSIKIFDNLNFEAKPGKTHIIYGPNGVGKTTLLKIIAGIITPNEGNVGISGRVTSLIDITMGFDPEATGYENIFTKGILMGFSVDLIKENIEKIESFSELGDYLNLPLKTYSSGMAMRLGFAINTTLEADIVLMDEWLTVGDENFQTKASKKIRSYLSGDKICIIASHDKNLIDKLSAHAYLISNHKISPYNIILNNL